MKSILQLLAILAATVTPLSAAEPALAEKIRADLPKLGHRNWIVVADSAYPLQTPPASRPSPPRSTTSRPSLS